MVSTTNEIVNEVAPVEVAAQPAPACDKPITEEDFEKAQKLFQLGKKNLFLNKYDESVNNIGEACKAYAAKYGEMDPACAEVYFFYGRALLELARVENTVLGNALTGVPEESEPINDSRYGNPEDVAAEEKNEISEKVIDALCRADEEMKTDEEGQAATTVVAEEAKPVVVTSEAAPESAEVVDVAAADGVTAVATATTTSQEGETATAAAATSHEGEEEGEEEADEEGEGEEGEEEEGEDVTNLQSSWEMFELAKVIYSKNFGEDALFKNKRIAECLLKLGEIGIEQETYEQAVTDIAESIRVQEEIACADRDERMLAESYYQLGLARQFSEQWSEANEAYQRSINIVQLRVEKLRGRLLSVAAEGADAELERNTINDEIGELEALLPEMTSKLEEVNEQNLAATREAREMLAAQMESKLAAVQHQQAAEVSGDVKDITSLVKSKRKIEECDNGSTKKTRLSEEGVEENKENNVTAQEPTKMEEVVAVGEETVNGNTFVQPESEPIATA